MLDLRPFNSLGRFEIDWLSARYHFSFANYHDGSRMGLGPLRVWNDDTVRAGGGFDPHPHRDMEIITYVRNGAITHRDNLGSHGRVPKGSIQVMSAGTGIVHSEFNLDPDDMTLFQIWIHPNRRGLTPRWEMRDFPTDPGTLHTLASGRDADIAAGAIPIAQDAAVLGGVLPKGTSWVTPLHGRGAYLVPTFGSLTAEAGGKTVTVNARDGLLVQGEAGLTLTALDDTEVTLVDVALPQ